MVRHRIKQLEAAHMKVQSLVRPTRRDVDWSRGSGGVVPSFGGVYKLASLGAKPIEHDCAVCPLRAIPENARQVALARQCSRLADPRDRILREITPHP